MCTTDNENVGLSPMVRALISCSTGTCQHIPGQNRDVRDEGAAGIFSGWPSPRFEGSATVGEIFSKSSGPGNLISRPVEGIPLDRPGFQGSDFFYSEAEAAEFWDCGCLN